MNSFIEQYMIDNREKLYRIAYSYAGNQEDALDIVSESVLRALRSQGSLRNRDALKTWMYRIVVNTAKSLLAQRGRLTYPGEEVLEQQEDREEPYGETDLRDALDRLPEGQRMIIILRYFEDMKIGDIAQILGMNPNTVKSRLYSALKLLRVQLSE